MVDFGGSLAVASMGLYATGVSTDLNGRPPPATTPGPQMPLKERVVLTPAPHSHVPRQRRQGGGHHQGNGRLRQKYERPQSFRCPSHKLTIPLRSWQDTRVHHGDVLEPKRRACRQGEPYQVSLACRSEPVMLTGLSRLDSSPKLGKQARCSRLQRGQRLPMKSTRAPPTRNQGRVCIVCVNKVHRPGAGSVGYGYPWTVLRLPSAQNSALLSVHLLELLLVPFGIGNGIRIQ